MEPTLVLVNGRIVTSGQEGRVVPAAAIYGNRILALGTNEKMSALAGRATRSIDLAGRTVLPGLCDAHIHLHDLSLSLAGVPIAGCSSKAEMLRRVASWLNEHPDREWVNGRGWNEYAWDDAALPTRMDIDPVTGNRPSVFWRSDMHCAVANSTALRLAGIDAATPDPPGGKIGRDTSGNPDGLLWELAINLVANHMPDPPAGERLRAMKELIPQLHSLGITAVHTQRMKDQHEGPLELDTLQRLRDAHDLKLRVSSNIAAHYLHHATSLGLRQGFGDAYLRLGHVKFFADGTLGSQTAWMLPPFAWARGEREHSGGISVTPPEQLAGEVAGALNSGFPVSVHAIGDQANRTVLDILEEVSGIGPALSVPHRIEHVQTIHPEDIPRLARLNVTASVQPAHLLDDMVAADRLLGPLAANTYSFGRLVNAGVRLAFGSDAPVATLNPFVGMHAALTRQAPGSAGITPWYPHQRLRFADIISAYTSGPAAASGWQDEIGTIAPGKRADLIVLDRDIFHLASHYERGHAIGDQLANAKVDITIFDGKIVYES